MKAFSLFGEKVKRALSERGFKRPTDIQEAAIPKVDDRTLLLSYEPQPSGFTFGGLIPQPEFQ